MTVKDILDVLTGPDRLVIETQSGVQRFVGWVSDYDHKDDNALVRKFRMRPELCSRQWKEKGLIAPVQPDAAPDYKFQDLELKLYYTVII